MSLNKQHHTGIRPVFRYEFLIKRVFLLGVIMFYLYRWYSHLLPYQIEGATMTKILYYPQLHLYKFLRLDDVLIGMPVVSVIYSSLLLLIPLLLFLWPGSRFLSWAFICINILYHTTYTASLTHAVHFWMAVILMSWIFIARTQKTFDLVWEGMRYYICLAYASAFIWKMLNGAFFQWDFGEVVFKSNLATYYYLYPDSFMHSFYAFFLDHPYLLNIGTFLSFIIEGLFILGFFTKKYDHLLIVLLIFLHHFLYLFVDTLFAEWYILILPFFSVRVWEKIYSRMPVLNRQ